MARQKPIKSCPFFYALCNGGTFILQHQRLLSYGVCKITKLFFALQTNNYLHSLPSLVFIYYFSSQILVYESENYPKREVLPGLVNLKPNKSAKTKDKTFLCAAKTKASKSKRKQTSGMENLRISCEPIWDESAMLTAQKITQTRVKLCYDYNASNASNLLPPTLMDYNTGKIKPEYAYLLKHGKLSSRDKEMPGSGLDVLKKMNSWLCLCCNTMNDSNAAECFLCVTVRVFPPLLFFFTEGRIVCRRRVIGKDIRPRLVDFLRARFITTPCNRAHCSTIRTSIFHTLPLRHIFQNMQRAMASQGV